MPRAAARHRLAYLAALIGIALAGCSGAAQQPPVTVIATITQTVPAPPTPAEPGGGNGTQELNLLLDGICQKVEEGEPSWDSLLSSGPGPEGPMNVRDVLTYARIATRTYQQVAPLWPYDGFDLPESTRLGRMIEALSTRFEMASSMEYYAEEYLDGRATLIEVEYFFSAFTALLESRMSGCA